MGICPREGVLFGANLGRATVTNGDFTYVCDIAATRPSSQITLGRFVIISVILFEQKKRKMRRNIVNSKYSEFK